MQLSIFDAPLARKTDPVTSHHAASRVREFSPKHCETILSVLRKQGPLTVDEIAKLTPLLAHQINKRLPELRRNGLADTTGETRLSASGRPERVWVAL